MATPNHAYVVTVVDNRAYVAASDSGLLGAKELGRTADFSPSIQPPGHTGDGELFGDQPEEYTKKNISHGLHVALAYFLFFGCSQVPDGEADAEKVQNMATELATLGVEFQ